MPTRRLSISLKTPIGASLKGVVGSSWAPKGQTPSVPYCCKWQKLSCIGGITLEGQAVEQTYEHAIKSAEVLTFLQLLAQTIQGKLLIFWNNAPIHQSRLIKSYLESDEGQRFTVQPLPYYALCARIQSHNKDLILACFKASAIAHLLELP